MELINSAEVKRARDARKLIDTLQQKLWATEQALDDLSRACEIAQFSRNFEVTAAFRDAADKILETRLTAPVTEQKLTLTVLEGELSDETKKQLADAGKVMVDSNGKIYR